MDDLINNCKNSVGEGFSPGKNIPYSLATKSTSVYRVTGYNQLEDIVLCGYVRPKGHGPRAARVGNVVYWSSGGSKLYYYDKRPVLEALASTVKDEQIGAISIEDLVGIWTFDEEQNRYVNNLEYYKDIYYQNVDKEQTSISR